MTPHEQLIKVWNDCEFDIKQRIYKNVIAETTLRYILATPTFRDEQKIESIIEGIKEQVEYFMIDARRMQKKISA